MIPANAVDAFHNNRHNISALYVKEGRWDKQMLILF